MQEVIASIKIRFSQLPTPKYLRIKKRDRDREVSKPRRELAKRREKAKRSATKRVIKNKGTTPKVPGSTKYIKAPRRIQKRMVSNNVGRKFFLFSTCSLCFWRLIVMIKYYLIILIDLIILNKSQFDIRNYLSQLEIR